MAVREKHATDGGIYFITFTICEWQRVFIEPRYINLIYKWFDYQRVAFGNKIHGYVIMPNHFHGLIYLSPASPPVSKLIQNAKRFLAYEIVSLLEEDHKDEILAVFQAKARKGKGAKHKVFEERFDSKPVENAKLFRQKLDYIHFNPCKPPWCLAERPEDYRHSSASNYLLGKGMHQVEMIS